VFAIWPLALSLILEEGYVSHPRISAGYAVLALTGAALALQSQTLKGFTGEHPEASVEA
jgi:hypothetical protein